MSSTPVEDFLRGATYVSKGCRAFYNDKSAWKYAAWPIVIMSITYVLLFIGIIYFAQQGASSINDKLSGLPGWLAWLRSLVDVSSYILGIVLGLLILGTTCCTLFEIFGGLFFDSLVSYYEKKTYGIAPQEVPFLTTLKFCMDSLFFGIKTSLVFVFLLIASLFLPLVGQIILVLVMGYYICVSYMICSANNSGASLAKLRYSVRKKNHIVVGFGATAYILLLIPFASIVLLPGLVLGGTELFHDEIREQMTS